MELQRERGVWQKGRFRSVGRRKYRLMEHHLYVCDKESEELRRHIAFRDYLREHEGVAVEYGHLKEELAREAKVERAIVKVRQHLLQIY